MSDVDKAAVTQADNVAEKPRKRGFMGHCARFWWAYLIAVVVIVVVVVPVVLLVGVPKIAQQKLDEAELIVDGITIINTQAQNLSMAINSTIKTDGSTHATIDAFQGVMYLEDLEPHRPFAKINFPETTSDAFQTVNVSQFLPIEDVGALTVFNTWLLTNESLRVTVFGETNIHVKGISRAYPVTFKKIITMPGLRMFDGTVVNETSISLLKPDDLGNNFRGTAYIPNRSLFTFELGNVTFHNYLQGKEIGTVYIDNLTLKRGVTVAVMRATIDNTPVAEALREKPYCEGNQRGILPFQIQGKSVINHDQPLPYYAVPLASGNQTISIDIGGTLSRQYNLTFTCK